MLASYGVVLAYMNQQVTSTLIIVKGDGPTLFGMKCFDHVVLHWKLNLVLLYTLLWGSKILCLKKDWTR